MKKAITISSMVIMVLVLTAVSISFTYAYFADKDTAKGTMVTSEYLDVTVDLVLAQYGIPSDTLLTATNRNAPDKSIVTVKNEGSVDMKYKLFLTIDKDTAELLEKDGVELIGTDDEPLHFTDNPDDENAENVIYVYENPNILKKGESDAFGLALTFKGEALIDGNDYQNKQISIKPSVEAVQVGGGE